MESEIERLTAENERLKEQQWKLWQLSASSLPFELRGPIASVRGYTELLLTHEAENLTEQQQEFLGQIKLTSIRLTDLISSLSDYARFGIVFKDDVQITLLKEIKDGLILACDIRSNTSETLQLEVTENFSVDINQFGIQGSRESIQNALSRILEELHNFYLIEKSYICLFSLNDKCVIEIKVNNVLREAPLFLSATNSPQSHFEGGNVDWVACNIIELYRGAIESGLDQNQIVVKINLPLVELDKLGAE